MTTLLLIRLKFMELKRNMESSASGGGRRWSEVVMYLEKSLEGFVHILPVLESNEKQMQSDHNLLTSASFSSSEWLSKLDVTILPTRSATVLVSELITMLSEFMGRWIGMETYMQNLVSSNVQGDDLVNLLTEKYGSPKIFVDQIFNARSEIKQIYALFSSYFSSTKTQTFTNTSSSSGSIPIPQAIDVSGSVFSPKDDGVEGKKDDDELKGVDDGSKEEIDDELLSVAPLDSSGVDVSNTDSAESEDEEPSTPKLRPTMGRRNMATKKGRPKKVSESTPSKTSRRDVEKPFSCPECDNQYKNRTSLKRHLQYSHSTSGDKKFHCDECLCTFDRLGKLESHVRRSHPPLDEDKERVEGEDHNLEGSPPKKRVRLAVPAETTNSARPYECSQCDRTFVNAGNLVRHATTHEMTPASTRALFYATSPLISQRISHASTHSSLKSSATTKVSPKPLAAKSKPKKIETPIGARNETPIREGNDKKLRCPRCPNRVFERPCSFANHMYGNKHES